MRSGGSGHTLEVGLDDELKFRKWGKKDPIMISKCLA